MRSIIKMVSRSRVWWSLFVCLSGIAGNGFLLTCEFIKSSGKSFAFPSWEEWWCYWLAEKTQTHVLNLNRHAVGKVVLVLANEQLGVDRWSPKTQLARSNFVAILKNCRLAAGVYIDVRFDDPGDGTEDQILTAAILERTNVFFAGGFGNTNLVSYVRSNALDRVVSARFVLFPSDRVALFPPKRDAIASKFLSDREFPYPKRAWLNFRGGSLSQFDILDLNTAEQKDPRFFKDRYVLIGDGFEYIIGRPGGDVFYDWNHSPIRGVELHARVLENMLSKGYWSRIDFATWCLAWTLSIVYGIILCFSRAWGARRSLGNFPILAGVGIIFCIAIPFLFRVVVPWLTLVGLPITTALLVQYRPIHVFIAFDFDNASAAKIAEEVRLELNVRSRLVYLGSVRQAGEDWKSTAKSFIRDGCVFVLLEDAGLFLKLEDPEGREVNWELRQAWNRRGENVHVARVWIGKRPQRNPVRIFGFDKAEVLEFSKLNQVFCNACSQCIVNEVEEIIDAT